MLPTHDINLIPDVGKRYYTMSSLCILSTLHVYIHVYLFYAVGDTVCVWIFTYNGNRVLRRYRLADIDNYNLRGL